MSNKPVRVLFVEDDEEDYLLTSRLLSQFEKIHLTWAPSYEKAIGLYAKEAFDICLIDYRLGIHSGLELIEELSHISPWVPLYY